MSQTTTVVASVFLYINLVIFHKEHVDSHVHSNLRTEIGGNILNTRGIFELAKIVIEHHVTLRSSSSIQEGVVVEAGAMLLEKSLAMTVGHYVMPLCLVQTLRRLYEKAAIYRMPPAEIIDADSVWQDALAARLFTYPTTSTRPSTSFVDGREVLAGMEDTPLHFGGDLV
jgi:hypothetical protein